MESQIVEKVTDAQFRKQCKERGEAPVFIETPSVKTRMSLNGEQLKKVDDLIISLFQENLKRQGG